ncbi:hypothetical protein BDA99DRAFT_558886 [Phascolomyces articulosus]|uniref:Uncharacterized protein n=1 Tax=Phascolomyces articulosus TaxID=60185 RepID=A0AAD5KCX1_9FUNG|nr:hypothetical protein BDA99DRAFT_558886 [Phascolomyces articulosus]
MAEFTAAYSVIFIIIGFIIVAVVCLRYVSRQSKKMMNEDNERRRQRGLLRANQQESDPEQGSCQSGPPSYHQATNSVITLPPPAYTDHRRDPQATHLM